MFFFFSFSFYKKHRSIRLFPMEIKVKSYSTLCSYHFTSQTNWLHCATPNQNTSSLKYILYLMDKLCAQAIAAKGVITSKIMILRSIILELRLELKRTVLH